MPLRELYAVDGPVTPFGAISERLDIAADALNCIGD